MALVAVIASVLRENERRVRGGEAMFPLTSHAAILRGPDICLYRALPTKPAADPIQTATGAGVQIKAHANLTEAGEGVQQLFLAIHGDEDAGTDADPPVTEHDSRQRRSDR